MTDAPKTSSLDKIRFFYIKNPSFRVAHVDGAVGGITPRGLIHMAVYSERPAIPQSTVHSIAAGVLGDAVSHEGKEGVVRELDIDLIMTPQVAKEVRDWLDAQLKQMEVLTSSHPDGTNNARG